MKEKDIKSLWQTSNQKLENSLNISKKQTENISQLKVQNFISSMKPIKILTILVGVLWVGLGTVVLSHIYLYAFSEANKFFLFSASIQVGLTAIALFIYLYQLITIYQIDITEPIIETQEKLASLRATTLWITRILFLQLPVWTTFYWNESMLGNGNWFLWVIQLIITFSFTYVAIWLFFNIKYVNKDKKWFRLIFNGKEWNPVLKSMDLLEQVDDYKRGNRPVTNAST